MPSASFTGGDFETQQPPYGPAPAPLAGSEFPSFRFSVGKIAPKTFVGGTAKEATVAEFPVSDKLAGVYMTLEPGALREMHWHANAAEWAYVIDGHCRTATILTIPETKILRSCSRSTMPPISRSPLPPGWPPRPIFCSPQISKCRKVLSPPSPKAKQSSAKLERKQAWLLGILALIAGYVSGTLNNLARHLALAVKEVPRPDATGQHDTHARRAALLAGAAASKFATSSLLFPAFILSGLAIYNPGPSRRAGWRASKANA